MSFDGADYGHLLGDAWSVVDQAWAKAWMPREPLTISQWAERHRVLPDASSAEPGPWRNARNPHLVEIMDCLSPVHPAEKVVFKKPTQVGGTEVLINAIGHAMCHDPGPIMLLVPGIDLAERHSKQRIAPSIEASEEWSRVVPPARSRDSGNTVRAKEFPGGILVIATANSSTGLRSMPVRYLFCDEVDEMLRNLNGQGSALEIAVRRTGTYQGRRKIYLCSSPTIKGDSIIDDEYEASDQRQRHVPCPHCERLQVLMMDNLGDDGTYLCEHCGQSIEEHHKDWMFERGVWIPRFPDRDVPGFHLNALYAPYRLGESWLYIAGERAKAKADPSRQVTFSNTYEGLAFEGERQQADPDILAARAEPGRHRGRVPRGSLLLTIGVDCQHDRFEAQVLGWGRGQRAAVVDYDVIPGDPSSPEGFGELDTWLQRSYRNCTGALMVGQAVAIDGGNWTEMVAQFVKSKVQRSGQSRLVQVGGGYQPQRLYVVRGRSAKSERVVYKPAKTEVNDRDRTIARSVGVWGVGTDVAKHILYGRITADANPELDIERRMLRFPGGNGEAWDPLRPDPGQLPPEYYKGLTVEYYDLAAKRWITPKGARNEPFDTLVYAYWAALSPAVRLDMIRDHEWTLLEERLEPAADLFAPTAPDSDSRETLPAASPAPVPTPAPGPVASDSRGTAARPARQNTGIGARDGWAL